jgi:hypothetical protein
MKTLKIWLAGLAALVAITVMVRGATVTATLDPEQIALGDSTQLTVTVSGSSEQPTLPNIDGLVVQSVSQGTQISIVNGSMTSSASVTYEITPQRAGTFTIPALQVGDAKSQPLTLRVGQGSAAMAQAPANAQPQAPPPSNPGPVVMPPNAPVASATVPAGSGRYGSIEVTVPKKEFYEGEMVPVQIKAFIPREVQATNYEEPQITSDGLTVDSLSTVKPSQTNEVVEGRVYTVLTWNSSLTALKPGDFTINLKMPLTIVVARQAPQTSDDDDSFNNFFRNAFAAMDGGEKKEVTITGDTEPLKVLPLPQASRPAGFTGAVGQFDAATSASPTKVNAGDPVTLKLTITGRGNFDRVSSDMLASDSNWKTYSTKNHFDAQDSIDYEGTKTFEQPVIPNNGSITAVPSLTFSYFDPEARRYVTRTCPPIPIDVSGAAASPAPVVAPAPSGAVASANPPPAPAATGPDLRMNRIESGSFVATLRPVYLSPLFLAGQALPLLALLGGLAFLRNRRDALHPDRARLTAANQAVRREVEAMDAAMRDQQAGPFFVHARNALQQRFGQQWNMRPEAITVTDVEARVTGDSSNLRSIFEMADQASYSDLHFGEADLQQWRQVVMNELAETKR